MGSSQRRTRKNERNQNEIEEKRKKDKERKRRRRTILREEEIPNEAMMEEANPIDIGIISKLCNLILIFIFIVYNLIVDKFHSLQFHSLQFHQFTIYNLPWSTLLFEIGWLGSHIIDYG